MKRIKSIIILTGLSGVLFASPNYWIEYKGKLLKYNFTKFKDGKIIEQNSTQEAKNCKKREDVIFEDIVYKDCYQCYKKTSRATKSNKIIKTAKKYLGRRYKFGGFDCSKFTQIVFKKNGKSLPRTAASQVKKGKFVKKKDLIPGDLILFKNTYKRGVSHTGIYLGNNKFIHASSAKKKVVISSLNKRFYQKHYHSSRRLY